MLRCILLLLCMILVLASKVPEGYCVKFNSKHVKYQEICTFGGENRNELCFLNELMSVPQCLPSFGFLSSPDTGSSFIWNWLGGLHPQVIVPDRKEIIFFQKYRNDSRSEEEIMKAFRRAYVAVFPLIYPGEITCDGSLGVAPYIYPLKKQLLPWMRYFYTIRNPVDFHWISLQRRGIKVLVAFPYLEMKRDGVYTGLIDPWKHFKEISDRKSAGSIRWFNDHETNPIRNPTYWHNMCPTDVLKEARDVFGKDNIMTIMFEKLKSNAASEMDRITEFLGLSKFDWNSVKGVMRIHRHTGCSISPYARSYLVHNVYASCLDRLLDEFPFSITYQDDVLPWDDSYHIMENPDPNGRNCSLELID